MTRHSRPTGIALGVAVLCLASTVATTDGLAQVSDTVQLSPIIGVDPTSLDFGRVCLAGCEELQIDIFNDVDDAQSILEITDLSVLPPEFEIQNPPQLPIFLPGDGQTVLTLTIQFCPSTPGAESGTLTITAAVAVPPNPLLVPLSGVGNSPPACNAGGPYSGNQRQPIQFNASATDPDGGPLTYSWDFGDGGTGTGPSPTHAYTDCGPYLAVLTVTDDCGAVGTCEAPVDVNCDPVCDAAGPYSGSQGDPVQFDGTASTDPDGDPLTYSWDFGDGGQGTGPSPTHTYTDCGPFVVTLTVSDPEQASSTCTADASINCDPICNAGGPYSGNQSQSIQFDGTASTDPDLDPLTYSWDFGDGGQGTGPSPTHAYVDCGTFTVTLTVDDGRNGSSTCTATADINCDPICDAGGPYNGTVNQPLTFNGSASTDPDGDPLTYTWDFGDGAQGSGPTPSHTYTMTGTYIVTLCVDDAAVQVCCETTAEITDQPNRPPVCDAGGPYAGNQGEAVQFDGSESTDPDGDPLTYTWDFGDGGTGTGPTPSHTYQECGPFVVSLTVDDGRGGIGTCTADVDINCAPICDAGGPYDGIVDNPVQFDGTGSSDPDGDPLSYSWDFGDGGTATGPMPSHTYTSQGTFTVTLCVDDGAIEVCCQTEARIIMVTAVELASFTATSDDGTVTLNWRTSFEDMNLGFDVQRAEEGSVAFVTVNEQMIEGQGDSPGAYSFTDRTATPGTTYDYQLVAYDLRGGHQTFGPIQVTVSLVAPKQISLGKNKPNPFNPSTTITFALPEATRVTLRVYNAQGQLVRTLVDDVRGAAEHSVEWDGRDDRGNALSTGVYLYRLEAGSTVLQNKMVLAK